MFAQRLIFLSRALSFGIQSLRPEALASRYAWLSEIGRFMNRLPVCLLEFLELQVELASTFEKTRISDGTDAVGPEGPIALRSCGASGTQIKSPR
jgi:hypothetical protein